MTPLLYPNEDLLLSPARLQCKGGLEVTLKRVLKQRTDNGERYADMDRILGEDRVYPWHMNMNLLDQLVKDGQLSPVIASQ